MTEKQEMLLRFIREYSEQKGCAPTLKEMAAAIGVGSPSVARFHVRKLEEAGVLRPRGYGKARDIELIGGGNGALAA
jgi:repressor LexA